LNKRADARTRTGDPIITSDVLYQLSYVGNSPTVAGWVRLLGGWSGSKKETQRGARRLRAHHPGSKEEAVVARVATFERINVEVAERTMDEAMAIVRPMVENLAGYQGFVELLTPDGKAMSITLFDTPENAEAAEPTFDEEMPRRLGELFSADWEGRRVSVDRYKVLANSREPVTGS
jgi:hypothetical protein